MAIPVFVDQILGRGLAQGAKPLRAVGRHPDKIAGLDGIPTIAQAVDAAAFEHQQAVLHHMNFDQRQRGAGLVAHGVHSVVEAGRGGQQLLYLQRVVSRQGLPNDRVFRAEESRRGDNTLKRNDRLLNDGNAAFASRP